MKREASRLALFTLLFCRILSLAQSAPRAAPAITWFDPNAGRGGEILAIQGQNFPATTNNLRVSFCTFADVLQVPVLYTSSSSMAVRVPTNGWTVFHGPAYICIEVDGLLVSTATLDPPQEFTFIGPPQITGTLPGNGIVVPGGLLQLQGLNFEQEAGLYRVYIDGIQNGSVHLASDEYVLVELPPTISAGSHTIALQLRSVRSAPFTFTVRRPLHLSAGTRGNGLSIRVNRPDFSNAPDGQISILEGALIANGTLGRPIETHLPCESLPASDPNSCPRRPRESDLIQYLNEGPNGGPNSSDFVFLDTAVITNGTQITGVLPPLSGGDRYLLRITLNGQGSAPGTVGLDFDGTGETMVEGLTLRNFPSHGVWFHNGAFFNSLLNVKVENCGGHGAFFDNDARANDVFGLSVTNVGMNGLHLAGTNVWLNMIEAARGQNPPYTYYSKCLGYGVRLESGPSFNIISPGTVRENRLSGISIWGANTAYNVIGWGAGESPRAYDVVNNGGSGVWLTDFAHNCVVRHINASGNAGDGIQIDGYAFKNQVDRCSVGVNLFEGGTSLDLPNQGSGIRLAGGAYNNLIGSHVSGAGGYGTVAGNRDDGILIEGEETAYNTVTAQQIGLHSIVYNPFPTLRFLQNGKAGIRITGGAFNNTVGEWQYDLANLIFSSPEAGIVVEGMLTTGNFISGNQIGSYHQQFSFSGVGENNVGILVRSGASDNYIGWPGGYVIYPSIPGGPPDTGIFLWNVITRCRSAGILIENSDPITSPAFGNSIRNNLIGEEEGGAIAGNNDGIKIGYAALGNKIGGPYPGDGNRIRGNRHAGIWIHNSDVPAFSSRNIIQQNLIAEQGVNGPLRYPDYLSATPSGGIGLLVENSSGQFIGEDTSTTNIFDFNRIGIYMANSASNAIQGNWLSNQFIAGIVIRGGHENLIGGYAPEYGNVVSAFGLGDPGHGGVVLSQTYGNTVVENFIGYTAPGRGGVGLLITNSPQNTVGFWDAGNIIVTNTTNGIVLSGPDSFGNVIAHNYIGVDPFGLPLGNIGDGIRIERGAHHNQIGAEDEPNYIRYNAGAGVRVDGIASYANVIRNNSITANGALGIVLTNGGNEMIPAPMISRFDGTNVSGTVNVAQVPVGSRVQVFCDSDKIDPEGYVYLGEGEVQPNGTWLAPLIRPLALPYITATATPIDAFGNWTSTSQFGSGTTPPEPAVAFAVRRTDATSSASARPGGSGVVVFQLSLFASNAPVRVKSVTIQTRGSLPDATAVMGASLFVDVNGDGLLNAADRYLAGPVQFNADNGNLSLLPTNGIIEANTTERWLLAFNLAADTVVGSTFQLAITNAAAIDAEFLFPAPTRATAVGIFPINSAEFTISDQPAGQTMAAWKATVFTPTQLANPAISGTHADPDGDGLNNLLEYAFNLDPLTADRNTNPNGDRGAPRASRERLLNASTGLEEDFLVITFVRRKSPVDLSYFIDHSLNLSTWNQTPGTPGLVSLLSQQDIGPDMILQRTQYRADQPITGVGSLAEQFIRVRVELVE